MCLQQLKTILTRRFSAILGWLAQRQPFRSIGEFLEAWYMLRRLFLLTTTHVQQPPDPEPPGRQYEWVPAQGADRDEIRALDSQALSFHCPLDNGRHDTTAAGQGLGTLSLPPELVWSVIRHLDIPSLTTFRRVSKRAMDAVDTTFEYQQIMKQAPQIIRGTLTLEANGFTLHDAYITLSGDARCATCGGRAGFVYLITCERACSLCLVENRRWRPHAGPDRCPDHRLPLRVPSAVARPGTYGAAGGYHHHSLPDDRIFRNHWVRKSHRSRFWDAKQWRGLQVHDGISWYASPFFVSVSVPLVDRGDA